MRLELRARNIDPSEPETNFLAVYDMPLGQFAAMMAAWREILLIGKDGRFNAKQVTDAAGNPLFVDEQGRIAPESEFVRPAEGQPTPVYEPVYRDRTDEEVWFGIASRLTRGVWDAAQKQIIENGGKQPAFEPLKGSIVK